MAIQAFTYTSNNSLIAQPDPGGEQLVVRSTDASDTMNITLHGTIASVDDSEVVALTGEREKITVDDFEALLHAQLASTSTGTVSVFGEGTAAEGFIFVSVNPADGDTFTFGLFGFTRDYTFKSVLTGAANEIKLGATEDDTADNIKRALNDEGVENTNYGTGTTINEYVTADVSSQLVQIVDKIPCARRLAWVLTQSGTGLTLQAPIGGADGTLLAELTSGVTTAADDITTNNEDLSEANLPAGLAFVSDWITVFGSSCSLVLNVASTPNLTFSYDTQVQATGTVLAGQTSISSVGGGTAAVVNLGENAIQRIRLKVTNGGATARNISAHVVYQEV